MRYIDTDYESDLRYDIPKFCSLEEDVFDIMDSFLFEKVSAIYKRQFDVKDLAVDGVYEVTTQEYRPDIISYEIYGDTQYWWLLMDFNNIIDIFSIVTGVQIQYFSLSELEDIYFSLNGLQKEQDRT